MFDPIHSLEAAEERRIVADKERACKVQRQPEWLREARQELIISYIGLFYGVQ